MSTRSRDFSGEIVSLVSINPKSLGLIIAAHINLSQINPEGPVVIHIGSSIN